MIYYDHRFDSQQSRYDAIVECAWQLPRPAIIYTTEVDEAKLLHQRLRDDQGFRRIECFHGETRPKERRRLLTQWRDDELDLMVATSAFGLEVDKADIRAVVHACYPEDLNRYYQEVGRGGRDGYSNVCLLLPTPEDYHTASGLAPTLLGKKLIQLRWEALWDSKTPVKEDEYVWELCLTSKRQKYIGVRTWAENVRWNKRLILQLQRAGKLAIKDLRYVIDDAEDSDPAEWVQVQLKSGFSPGSPNVGESIADQRHEEITNSRRGLAQIDKYLHIETCISRILRDLFGEATLRLCGGCRCCRREGRPVSVLPRVEFEVSTRTLVPPDVTVVENCPVPEGEHPRSFLSLLRRCIENKGIRRFATSAGMRMTLLPLFESAFPYRAEKYRLDDLDYEQPFVLRSDERIIVFHFNEISRKGAQFDGGSEIVHLLGRGLSFQNIRYELPARCTSPRFHPDVEQWLM
jgi:ATP-dependent DNA helicase RecQ